MNVKSQFPIFKERPELIYLDTAASSQKPQAVIDAVRKFYEISYSNVHRGIHDLAEEATEQMEEARKKVALLINAKPEETIFTSGTTQSINIVANSLCPGIKKGRSIVVTSMEHHSNLVPWQQLADRYGLELRVIPLTPDKQSLDMEKARELIDKSTAIVAVVHVSNVLGILNPVEKLAEIAHKHNSLIVVDGAQAIAHLPVDVKALNVDFYAFSGHKMYGPTGIGVLYGKEEILKRLEPSVWGGEMVDKVSFSKTTFKEPPHRLEPGTPNIAGAIGLGAAVDFLNSIGYDGIQRHEKEVITHALERLKHDWLTILGQQTPENRQGTFSFVVDRAHPHDLADFLNTYGIAVRAGHHCTEPLHCTELGVDASTRASIGVYTAKDDIDRLAEALELYHETGGEVAFDRNQVGEGELTQEQRLHAENIKEHAKNPRNNRAMPDSTVHLREKNPFCGDEIEVFMKIHDGKIEDISFEGTGCAISQASISLLTKKLKNMNTEEVLKLEGEAGRTYMLKQLGIPIGPVRMKCALLGLRTIQKAIR